MSTGPSAFWRYLPCGGATYWRVVGEGWTDAADTSYSKKSGGRWNPSGAFGVLYLNATRATAKANAVRYLAGHGLEIEDLLPGTGPHLVAFEVEPCDLVDVVTDDGIAVCGLPDEYPRGVDHAVCQRLGVAFHAAGEVGIACRSAQVPDTSSSTPDEAPLIDYEDGTLPTPGARRTFEEWFPAP